MRALSRSAAVFLLLSFAVVQVTTSQRAAFRSAVDLVSLNVSVSNGRQYVSDLRQEDFSVFEDGIAQEITFFDRARLPMALALLLDTSASMEGKLATAQQASLGLIRQLGPNDMWQLMDFDDQVKIVQPFTNRQDVLEPALQGMVAGGSTALYNAIYIALRELAKGTGNAIRRQAIVVLSDGDDTSSLIEFEDVLDLARRSQTVIFAIGLRPKVSDPTAKFNDGEFVLRRLAQHTGGRAFFASEAGELVGVYGQIADELSNQYTLGYISKNPRGDAGWRRLAVRLRREGLVARTKQGYFASNAY